jgi:hypothetical protein
MTKLTNDTDLEAFAEAERALARKLAGIAVPHPRLHLAPGGVAALRERAAGTHERYARLLFDWVESHQGWSPPVELPYAAINLCVL